MLIMKKNSVQIYTTHLETWDLLKLRVRILYITIVPNFRACALDNIEWMHKDEHEVAV